MNVTGTIDGVLQLKGRNVFSVSPEITVFEAIQVLAEKNVGALLVMSGEQLVGLFSERDYTRKIAIKGKSSKLVFVKEIMSPALVTITPQQSIEEGLRLMNNHRVRHLPVLDAGKVVGIVSIGNLVNWVISAQNAAIDQLHDYITGKY